ncbi:MAG: hypothetical protein IPG92_08615 [Flavobacteriales bacterium]|nr:hypothetical protein [Flavobacteriales bacterium]
MRTYLTLLASTLLLSATAQIDINKMMQQRAGGQNGQGGGTVRQRERSRRSADGG